MQYVSISISLQTLLYYRSQNSHIGSCCPCPPLCVSWSPGCNQMSRGVSHWLCAGCLMERWSCSEKETDRKRYYNLIYLFKWKPSSDPYGFQSISKIQYIQQSKSDFILFFVTWQRNYLSCHENDRYFTAIALDRDPSLENNSIQ